MQLQTYVGKASRALRAGFGGIMNKVRQWGVLKTGIGVVVFVAVVYFAAHFFGGSSAAQETQGDQTPSVTLSTVGDLSANTSPLSIIGTVSSVSEATVRAEKSGEVTELYYALGDYVSAGSIIAQIDNASERAAVLQAQGVVDAASASAGVSQTTLSAAQDNAVATLLSAYAAIDNAVHSDADPMFSNPEGSRPLLIVQTSDTQKKINAEYGRQTLTTLIARESARSTSLTSSDDLLAEFAKTEDELRVARDFFDALVLAMNAGIATGGISATDIATFKAEATAGRTAITAALSASIAARQSLETTLKNTSQTSGTSANSATAKQAQGALAAAQANLEKSIIRAPISGTINSLPLKRGDFIQMLTPAVTVANNGALEIKAYITDTDAQEISVGAKALVETSAIQSGITGVVTHIAPALDPVTKKIEVRVGITQGSSLLVNGQSVIVNFARKARPTTTSAGRITIPIAALKVGGSDMSVFTVDATSSVLVAHTVTIGALLGDRVVIESGISTDMNIVTDARGLRAGEVVTVK